LDGFAEISLQPKHALYRRYFFSTSKSKLIAESKILRARPLLAYFPDNLSGCRKAIKPGFFNAFLSITFIIRKSNFIGKKHSMAYPGVCNLTLWEPLRGQRAKQDTR
jgi:hypothetical protein